MPYASIYAFEFSPESPAAGERVDVTLIIQNTSGVPVTVMGDITYAYGGQTYAVTYDGITQVQTLDPGGYLVIQAHFTMPSQSVELTGRSYYYGTDLIFHLDQTQSLNVPMSVPTWILVYSLSISITYFTEVSNEFVLVGTMSITISRQPTSGEWLLVGTRGISISYQEAAGEWVFVATRNLSVNYPAPPTVVITTSSLPNGVVGKAYSKALTASGGATPYTWAITSGALPAGLTLSSSGLISGTPTVPTQTPVSITFRVTDDNGLTATKQLTLTVGTSPPPAEGMNWGIIALAGAGVLGAAGIAMAVTQKKPAPPVPKEVSRAVSRR